MNYEKEPKYILSEKEFNEIIGKKIMNCMYMKQNNYYYNDNNFSLSKRSCTLRVIEKQDDIQLQLKKTISMNNMYRTSQEHSVDIIDSSSIIRIEEIEYNDEEY